MGSFVLGRLLTRDEFSIRYVATASASGGEVVIEEFAPAGMSLRDASGELRPRSPAQAALWEEGLQAFLQESELLARPLHPALVRVASLWRIRGTAFRMWPSVEGRTLAEVCALMTEPPTEAWLRGLVAPLLDALESLHDAGWVHGNIGPGQILMRPGGGPTLLDTAAVRTAIGARMPQLSAWPEPGFRPPELAKPTSEHAPGPWSDLYSLAAVVRFCMDAPHAADGLSQRPGVRSTGHNDSLFVSVFERALASDPSQRPQTVAMFRRQLQASAVSAALATPPAPLPEPEPPGIESASIELEPHAASPRAWLEPVDADPLWAREATRTPPARRWPWVFAGVLAVLASAALAAYQLTRDEVTPLAGKPPPMLASAEQLPERDLAAAGSVAAVASDPRPEPPQAVVTPTPLPPLLPQEQPERPAPAPAPAPAAPAAMPLPAPDTPPVRRPAAADTPAAVCAPRTNFALYRCMKVQCEQSRHQAHPQCVRLRQNDELPT